MPVLEKNNDPVSKCNTEYTEVAIKMWCKKMKKNNTVYDDILIK